MSRPSIKTPELIREIIDLLLLGYNISAICSRKGMPNRVTVYRWLWHDSEFRKAYKKAASIRSLDTFLDVYEIADRPKANAQEVAADRLRVDTRLRAAALATPVLKGKRRKTVRSKFVEPLPGELE